ncbi:MAG TPA: hypothetical protein VGZ22_11720 [Isosphaeraceae bacterium]|jgi:hypothetical protein|nr:hypothetical protein [Isosphaeraceae bacterium]
MRFLLWFLFRFVGYGLLGLTVLAIVVGGMEQPQHARRILRTCVPLVVNGYLFSPQVHEPLFLDPETGRTQNLVLPVGEQLDQISFSPWRNEQGESQVVGLWASGKGKDQDWLSLNIGLARYTFPGGQLVDRVSTEVLPSAPVCWFPDSSDRILFAAADGQLYRFRFDTGSESGARQPLPLTWQTKRPGLGPLFLGDPAWPADPRFAGRIFATLSYVNWENGQRRYSPQQVWCLRVNPTGSAVVAAARLTAPDGSNTEIEERCPSLTITPSGVALFACLSRRVKHSPQTWQLELKPLVLDETKQRPPILTASARVLSDNCLPVAPRFSEDGRWVTCVERGADGQPRLRRLAVGDVARAPDSMVRRDGAASDGPVRKADLDASS